jgi:hypothetical protein
MWKRGEFIRKRGQAWGFDLMIASVLFISGIVIFYIYSINYPTEGRETLDQLSYEGDIISDQLFSSGSPSDWNSGNIVRIGIHDNNKINESKLERLYNLDYQTTRILFNTKFHYFLNFSDVMTINAKNVEGIGIKPNNQKNLIKITRYTIYQEKPVTLNLFIWE